MKCRFFDEMVDLGSAQRVNVCRLNPPIAFAVMAMTNQGPGVMQGSTWPRVTASDWCDKFQLGVKNG
jgi:hypothetical protein